MTICRACPGIAVSAFEKAQRCLLSVGFLAGGSAQRPGGDDMLELKLCSKMRFVMHEEGGVSCLGVD